MVRKSGSRYKALSESGRSFGTYDSKAEADKRIAQMEYWKYKKSRGKRSVK